MKSTDIKIRMQYFDLTLDEDVLAAEATVSKAAVEAMGTYELIHILADKLYTQIERHITG